MTNPTQDQFFAGGGESLKWPADVVQGHYVDTRMLNVWRGGRITAEPKVVNQTEYMKPGVVRTWDDGTPRQQMVVSLRCDGSRQGIPDERNTQNPQDYGDRSLYVKTGLRAAIQEELRKHNLTGMAVGGELYVAWTGEAPTEFGKPARVYAAKYIPPQPNHVPLPAEGPAAPPQQPAQAPTFQQPAADPWGQAPAPAPVQPPAAPNPFGQPAAAPAPLAPPNPWS